jgi:DNA-binding transcriptional LysR family regulator
MVTVSAAPAFREQFSELAHEHRLSPQIVQESDRLPAILTMVAAGSGLSMVPATARHLVPKGIVLRKLPSPAPLLFHTFAYRTENRSPSLADFLQLVSKVSQ